MKIKNLSLIAVALIAQIFANPLTANCFDFCWGRSKQVEEEMVSTEVEQIEEKIVVEVAAVEVAAIEKTPFYLCVEAVSQGDVEAFRENLAFIEDVDAEVDGLSLIGIIAGLGTVEQLEILLERDPKVNVHSHDSEGLSATPLLMACIANNTGVAKALVLNAGADVNFFNQDLGGFTPLNLAILTENLELVRFFIENGADLTLDTSINGEEKSVLDSVLDLAILLKNPEIENLIREKLDTIAEVEREALVELDLLLICRLAIYTGDVERFKDVLAQITDIDATFDGGTLLGIIAQSGTVEFLEILLEREPKVNVFIEGMGGLGYTPLQIACITQNTAVVKALVQKANADINLFKKDGTQIPPLYYSMYSQNVEFVRFFVQNGADLSQTIFYNGEEVTALDFAILSKNKQIENLIRENMIEFFEQAEEE